VTQYFGDELEGARRPAAQERFLQIVETACLNLGAIIWRMRVQRPAPPVSTRFPISCQKLLDQQQADLRELRAMKVWLEEELRAMDLDPEAIEKTPHRPPN
jgi:hypothetical protein